MKNKITIIIFFLFVFAGCWFLFFHDKSEPINEPVTVQEAINPYGYVDIKAVIIQAEEHTFGYDIYMSGSVLVHQPSRPGLPGNIGFATEDDAMKVAKLVIKKIHNNEMPPTVTIEELRELGVITE